MYKRQNYNSAVSSGNYSVQAAQNEAAIAKQKLQDYYAQRDAAQNDVQDKIPDEEKFSDSSEFDAPGNTDDFGNTDDPENSDDSGNTDRTDCLLYTSCNRILCFTESREYRMIILTVPWLLGIRAVET